MKFIEDFKKFALRGNIVDMAVGFTVGAAFTTVAKSLVNDVIMPPIGLLTGKVDFADKFILLKEGAKAPAPYATSAAADAAGAVTLNYGSFINNVIALVLVALAMFVIIRVINRIDDELEEQLGDDEKKPATEPSDKKCLYCRSTIPYRATRCPNCTSLLDAPEGLKLAQNKPGAATPDEPGTGTQPKKAESSKDAGKKKKSGKKK